MKETESSNYSGSLLTRLGRDGAGQKGGDSQYET